MIDQSQSAGLGGAFARWRRDRAAKRTAQRRGERIYGAIVAAARAPDLYAELGLEDSADGRFEAVFWHAALTFRRLRDAGPEGEAAAQEATDLMFADFDRNLREMGVGDMSVGKRMHQLAQTYFARARDMEAALGEADEAARRAGLRGLIERNARFVADAADPAEALTARLLASAARLEENDDRSMIEGDLAFR